MLSVLLIGAGEVGLSVAILGQVGIEASLSPRPPRPCLSFRCICHPENPNQDSFESAFCLQAVYIACLSCSRVFSSFQSVRHCVQRQHMSASSRSFAAQDAVLTLDIFAAQVGSSQRNRAQGIEIFAALSSQKPNHRYCCRHTT